MDLLAPCRSCLQCFPFFFDSPPSSPHHRSVELPSPSSHGTEVPQHDVAGDPHQQTLTSASEDSGQKALLPSPSEICTEVAPTENTDGDNRAEDLNRGSKKIIIAPPVVFAQNEGSHVPLLLSEPGAGVFAPTEIPLKVPFINDIDFSKAGLKPPASPMTPAPFGSGPHGQIQQGSLDENHGNGHGRGHDHSQHHHNRGKGKPRSDQEGKEAMAKKLTKARGIHEEELIHGAGNGDQSSEEDKK